MFHTHGHSIEKKPKAYLICPKFQVATSCMAVIILRNKLELFCHAISDIQEYSRIPVLHACMHLAEKQNRRRVAASAL